MAGQLQEGPGQGFSGCRPKGWVIAAQLLLLLNGLDEALGHVSLGGGSDAGVAIRLGQEAMAIQFLQAPAQAFEHLPSLFCHMRQLAIGEPWQVGYEHLAVVSQGEEGGAQTATAAIARTLVEYDRGTLGADWGHWSRGTATTGNTATGGGGVLGSI